MTNWNSYYRTEQDFQFITVNELDQILDGLNAKSALDLGCGTGQFARELYHRGMTVLGIDGSEEAINIATKSSVREGLEFRAGDITRPEQLPEGPFDLITCKLVYAFIENKVEFLLSTKQLLSKSGKLVIITPLKKSVPENKKGTAINHSDFASEVQRAGLSIERNFTSRATEFYLLVST